MEELEGHKPLSSRGYFSLVLAAAIVPEVNRAGGTEWLEAAVMLKSVSDSDMHAGVKAPGLPPGA